MALKTYTDVYNVDNYQTRVSDIAQGINELKSGNFYSEAAHQIERQIEILKTKERRIFKTLHVADINELNDRLEKYKRAVINLSGPGLYQSFVGVLKEKNAAEFEAFNNAVDAIITENILNNETIIDIGVENAANKVLEALNKGVGKNVHFHSHRGMTSTTFFPSSFTTEQKKEWKAKMKKKEPPFNHPLAEKWVEISNIEANKNSINYEFTWFDVTEQLTQTEAQSLDRNEVGEINKKIKELIISKVSSEDVQLISKIIDYILEKKNYYAFFVGRNENDITGLLGEIQGIYYLSKFLGNFNEGLIQWRGGTYTGDKSTKPHQDILLNGLGIQVKNTTREIFDSFGEVGFTEASIPTILERINISSYAKDVFENFYGTVNFNIEYHYDGRRKEGTRYLPGLRMSDKNAKKFENERQNLLKYQQDIDNLLSLFGATLMYLDVYEDSQKLDANVLFLLGGVAFQTASQILSELLKDIKRKEKRFRITASYKQDKNIITALNSSTRDPNYSQEVLKDIKLTSAYLF